MLSQGAGVAGSGLDTVEEVIHDTLGVALWATDLATPVAGPDAWLQRVEARLGQAREEGAELLMLPEYACAQWLHYAPADLPADGEIPWLAEQGERLLPALAQLAREYGIALLAGTIPASVPGRTPALVNRGHLLLPDGIVHSQDKLCLTPDERDPGAWHLASGDTLKIIHWRGLRLALVICLDSELPALAARLAGCRLDLMLVPSMTSQGGFWRVSNCCRARAVELFTTVCMVACSGRPRAGHPDYVGGAGVYVPCEQALNLTGVAAELPANAQADAGGSLLVARALPLAQIRALRSRSGEVWPGAWRADHVTIVDTADHP